jgi:hypothetical protein
VSDLDRSAPPPLLFHLTALATSGRVVCVRSSRGARATASRRCAKIVDGPS